MKLELENLKPINTDLLRKQILKEKAIKALRQSTEKLQPLLKPARFKALHGGRGSGKSHRFAELVVLAMLEAPETRVVCIREIQQSIRLSVYQLIVDKINAYHVGSFFNLQRDSILTPQGGKIEFKGMQNHTADSIKSLEGFDIAWAEEAQNLSLNSLTLLKPTMRKRNCKLWYGEPKHSSELWFSWNPKFANDPVDDFFRCNSDNSKNATPPDNAIVIEVNYTDNPYLYQTEDDPLLIEAEYDKRRDPDKYAHVWLGSYLTVSEAQVFKNWKVQDFKHPSDARFLFGADWGFSKDPTTLVRFWIGKQNGYLPKADPDGDTLFIDYEAYKVGCTIEQTPALFKTIPESDKWPIRADSARPETIDYMQRNGFPKMVHSTKGKNSVEEGIEFIKNYNVVIHPRCEKTILEFTHYSYKTDPKTEEILPKLKDDHNHIIDPIRYGLELVRKAKRTENLVSSFGPRLVSLR